MRRFAQFGTICTILRREKYPWRCVTFCKFTKSNTTPCVFFKFLKLYKWCQIAQGITDARPTQSFYQILNIAVKKLDYKIFDITWEDLLRRRSIMYIKVLRIYN